MSPCRCVFSDELYAPSAKPSVYTDGHIPSVYTDGSTDGINPSVYTDRFGDGIISVGINYRRNISVGNSVAFLRFSGSETCKVSFVLSNSLAKKAMGPNGSSINNFIDLSNLVFNAKM